jgi:hypothetical protein
MSVRQHLLDEAMLYAATAVVRAHKKGNALTLLLQRLFGASG